MSRVEELSPEVVRVLTEMRKILRYGWTQGQCQDRAVHCLIAAKYVALRWLGLSDGHPAGDEISGLLRRHIGCADALSLIDWNNVPGRTQEDVLRLLDGILARARK